MTGAVQTFATMCPMNCHPTLCGMLVDVRDGEVVSVRGGRFRPHYDPPGAPDGPLGELLRGLLEWCHARTARRRWKGLWRLIRAGRRLK